MAFFAPGVVRESILQNKVLQIPNGGSGTPGPPGPPGPPGSGTILLDGGTATTDYGATVVVDGGAPATVNTYKFNGGTA